jgi:hypothetical protein
LIDYLYFWLQMQVTFNAKERTLREIVALALSAGWKVTKVTRAQGSLFGHILAVPVDIPVQEDDDQDQNRPELAAECAEADSASVSAPAGSGGGGCRRPYRRL